MTASSLLRELNRRRVVLSIGRGRKRLHVSAPVGALSSELREVLRRQKWSLLALLERRPEGACYICSGTRYWLSVYHALVCGICHPPADPSLVAEWIELPNEGRDW